MVRGYRNRYSRAADRCGSGKEEQTEDRDAHWTRHRRKAPMRRRVAEFDCATQPGDDTQESSNRLSAVNALTLQKLSPADELI
jgi:hypothetical protein